MIWILLMFVVAAEPRLVIELVIAGCTTVV